MARRYPLAVTPSEDDSNDLPGAMSRMNGSQAVSRPDTAFAAMCWDSGGSRLVGLVVVRRSDSRVCVLTLPPILVNRLSQLDRGFVAANAHLLLKLAQEQIQTAIFERDRAITREFVSQGPMPSVAGTMRHISAAVFLQCAQGGADWRAAGFVVDVGEVELGRQAGSCLLH